MQITIIEIVTLQAGPKAIHPMVARLGCVGFKLGWLRCQSPGHVVIRVGARLEIYFSPLLFSPAGFPP